MKTRVYFLALCSLLFAGAICFSGCKTTSTLPPDDNKNNGILSIQVTLNEDGTFTYLGDIVEREDIPRVLKKATDNYGRSITIKAGNNVEKKELVEARQFLVYKGFPNVTIVTQRIAVSYEEDLLPDNN